MKISKESVTRLMAGVRSNLLLLIVYYALVLGSSAVGALLPQMMATSTGHAVAGDQGAVAKVIAMYAVTSMLLFLGVKIVGGRIAAALTVFFYGDTVRRLWTTDTDAGSIAAKARATFALRSVIIADVPDVAKTIINISVVLIGLSALGPKHVALAGVALLVGAGVTYLGNDALKGLVTKFHEFSHMEVEVVGTKDEGKLAAYLIDREETSIRFIKLDVVQWVVQAPVITAMTLASYWLSDGSATSLALILASYAAIANEVDNFSMVQRSVLSAMEALKHTA